MINKLALGTVQFGLDYGVSNEGGKTPYSEVCKILEYASKLGIDTLDTARLYGDSEEVLGAFENRRKFNVITKTELLDPFDKVKSLKVSLENSKTNLKMDINGLLFHRQEDLLCDQADNLFSSALELKESGLIKNIGVSVYDVESLVQIVNKYSLDIVQLPLSVFDQRFISSGCLKFLKEKGIEVHTRSVFLQGLLLGKELPSFFEPISDKFNSFIKLCNDYKITQLTAALSFALNLKEVDRVVVGVNNLGQLEQICSSILESETFRSDLSWSDLAVIQQKFIDPRKWGG